MNILSLQGGGTLGYSQATILSQIESGANKACYQLFNMICGTSVGSIIGSHLAIGVSASGIKDFFTQDAPKIFNGNIFNNISELFGSKYSANNLESALQVRLGCSTLSDCKTKFVATSYDWTTDRPVYFKSFEKSYSTKDYIVIGYDSSMRLWQIARASSAAQTYFQAYQYSGMVMLDGGNAGDNNPDMLCLTESLSFDNINNIKLLSLGAGDSKWNKSPKTMINPSIATAGIETIDIVFSAGESAEIYKAGKILKNNYCRFSPDLGNGYAIDDASKNTLSSLQLAAEKLNVIQSDFIKQIIS